MTAAISIDNIGEVYADGSYIAQAISWTEPVFVPVQADALLAVHGVDVGGPGAILVTWGKESTDATWKCTTVLPRGDWMAVDYDDSKWPQVGLDRYKVSSSDE